MPPVRPPDTSPSRTIAADEEAREGFTTAGKLALGATAAALVALLVIVLSGGGGETYALRFQNAGQLVKGDDVQVGGRRVGSVQEIALTDDNQAEIKVKIEKPFAPLHQGTTAVVRATSLSGIANRYIALRPGPNNRPELPGGTVLLGARTTTPVDLDQLFNTLDPRTRRSLQQVVQGSATQYAGAGEAANRSAKYFNPTLAATDRVVSELVRDQRVFTDFLVHSSRVVTTLADRRDDLANLVTNANTSAAAIAAENDSLDRALAALPATLRKANTTFVNLRATLDDLDVLVAESKPATRRLAPFLRALRPLVADARPTIADLRRLIREPGPNNDLVEATRKVPRLQRTAAPVLRRAITTLRKAQPVIEFIRPYAPELVGWLRDASQDTAAYDANGHYARIQPIFNAFSLVGNVLVPQPPANRIDGLQTAYGKRCPGAATQPAEDGSNPFNDAGRLDCDSTLVLPGP